jgi:predicted AAA+ superfamily ATPase
VVERGELVPTVASCSLDLRTLAERFNGLRELMDERTRTVAIESLTKEVDALHVLMDERDARYSERHESNEKAVASALVSAEKAVTAALVAQKEAVTKAEQSQLAYNQGHNDLSRKMESQYREMVPRTEAAADLVRQNERIDELKKEVQLLRESKSLEGGRAEQRVAGTAQNQWLITALLTAVGIGAGVLIAVLARGAH